MDASLVLSMSQADFKRYRKAFRALRSCSVDPVEAARILGNGYMEQLHNRDRWRAHNENQRHIRAINQ